MVSYMIYEIVFRFWFCNINRDGMTNVTINGVNGFLFHPWFFSDHRSEVSIHSNTLPSKILRNILVCPNSTLFRNNYCNSVNIRRLWIHQNWLTQVAHFGSWIFLWDIFQMFASKWVVIHSLTKLITFNSASALNLHFHRRYFEVAFQMWLSELDCFKIWQILFIGALAPLVFICDTMDS